METVVSFDFKRDKVLYIGVDPGNTTGIAMWFKNDGKLETYQFDAHLKAVLWVYNTVNDLDEYKIKFRIEDARKQRKRPDLAKANFGKQQGVGSVKARSKDWEDFCKHLGYDYELCEPKNTPYKDSPEKFKQLTGIDTKKTQSHLRDASMLVYGI